MEWVVGGSVGLCWGLNVESEEGRVRLPQVDCFFSLTSVPNDMGKPLDIKSKSFKTLKSFCFALFYIFLWEISNICRNRTVQQNCLSLSPTSKNYELLTSLVAFFSLPPSHPFPLEHFEEDPRYHIFHSLLNAV